MFGPDFSVNASAIGLGICAGFLLRSRINAENQNPATALARLGARRRGVRRPFSPRRFLDCKPQGANPIPNSAHPSLLRMDCIVGWRICPLCARTPRHPCFDVFFSVPCWDQDVWGSQDRLLARCLENSPQLLAGRERRFGTRTAWPWIYLVTTVRSAMRQFLVNSDRQLALCNRLGMSCRRASMIPS